MKDETAAKNADNGMTLVLYALALREWKPHVNGSYPVRLDQARGSDCGCDVA
jgi:hypothetical protein